MPKSKPTAKSTGAAKSAAKRTTPPTEGTAEGAAAPAPKTAKAARPGGKAAGRGARAKVQPRKLRLSDSEIDVTPVRIVDDRRFSGKFQIVEDEGEKRVLGWGFPSVLAARRWIENRNHLSAWLRFILRGE